VRSLARVAPRALALALLTGWLGVACAPDDSPRQDPAGSPVQLDASAEPATDADGAVASERDALPAPREASAEAGGPGVADAGSPESVDAGGVGPEPGRLAGITREHNVARERAITSTPLAPLTWSVEIAAVAQSYADKLAAGCANGLVHSTPKERNDWGENLAAFSITGGKGNEPNGTPRATVELWESELACYTFGPFQSGVNATCTEACKMYGGCGHLTQLLWRKTQRVGCGVADCTEGKTRKSYWVCNYDPAGNVTGQLPY
jgi:pathogenesis-related protein 1